MLVDSFVTEEGNNTHEEGNTHQMEKNEKKGLKSSFGNSFSLSFSFFLHSFILLLLCKKERKKDSECSAYSWGQGLGFRDLVL